MEFPENNLPRRKAQKKADPYSSTSSLNSEIPTPQKKIDNLAKFFIGERKTINIWTYLFKELSKSIDQILRMCEIESKIQFCKGVSQTLKYGLKSLEKIEHKIKLENQTKNQNCAWDVNFYDKKSAEDILRESGYEEKFLQIFDKDQEGLIEFKLLNELVLEGKMNFYEAIVLIVRERASICKEIQKNKGGAEWDRNKLRDSHEFINENENSRAISTPLPVTTLMNRINLKLKFVNIENEDFKKEELAKKLKDKLVLAENRKKLLCKKKKDEFIKQNLKVSEVIKKNNFLVKQKCDNIRKKEIEYHARKFNKLDEIKKKAEENRMKPSEVSFLMLLEKYSENTKFDSKLEQTRKKRLKIIKEIKETYKKNNKNTANAVLSKKEKLENIKKQKILQKLKKFEKANERRSKLLEIKKNNAKKKSKRDFYDILSGDIINSNQNDNYLLVDLFKDKERFDWMFNDFKILDKKLETIENPGFKSNSFHLENDNLLDLDFTDNKKSQKSIDKLQIKTKSKKKKKKLKQKNIKKKKETDITFLSQYYNFLTHNKNKKKTRLKPRKNRKTSLAIIKSQKIEELPELICREVAIKEKKSLQTNKFNYCKICEQVVKDVETHLNSKNHSKLFSLSKKKRYKENVMTLVGENKVTQQRFSALKRKCKKIKQCIQIRYLKNEDLYLKNEHFNSQNKTRLQKLTLDLEKLVPEQKQNYDMIDVIFKEIHKLVDKHNENDLHILRNIRFISVFIDFIKKSHFCSKFDFPYFIKILNDHFSILSKLCLIKENRNYFFMTNRVIPLVELFSWSSGMIPNNPELTFFPELLNLISFLLRHKVPKEKHFFKKSLIEYIYFSGFFNKIQKKFTKDIFIQMNDTPHKSMIILTCLKTIENLTSNFQNTKKFVLKKLQNPPTNILFVIKETEVAGSLHLLATILLSNGQFKRQIQIVSPICLTFSFFIIRIFNNIARTDLELFQSLLGAGSFNSDQLYHVAIFLFDYCMVNFHKKNEIFKVITELLLLIGYFALENDCNKNLLSRGTEKHCVVYKMCNLPFDLYFKDRLLREILIPSLICVIDGNERNLSIFEKVVDKKILVEYVEEKIGIIEGNDKEKVSEIFENMILKEMIGKEDFIDPSTFNVDFYNIATRFSISKLKQFKNFLIN